MGKIKIFSIFLFFIIAVPVSTLAGVSPLEEFSKNDTDTAGDTLVYFFDLRNRESFIQLTYNTLLVDVEENDFDVTSNQTIHIQIFDVSSDCLENDFLDVYTPADTHVYNMRNIQTNDGNPSGVVLPDDAFGFVFALAIDAEGTLDTNADVFIGNMRILDNNGYEYRANASVEGPSPGDRDFRDELGHFNYNTDGGVTLSDIVGIVFDDDTESPDIDVLPLDNFAVLNVDIFDLNETPFSCRNVIYACISPDSPLQDALIAKASDTEFSIGSASVARAEYGINNAIPHSNGGELLCPGNNISEGFVRLEVLNIDLDENDTLDDIVIWVGLNNGSGRGSFDSNWIDSAVIADSDGDDDG